MRPRIALLSAQSARGEIGGAERLFVGLRDALAAAGADIELVPVRNDESGFESIQETYLRYYDLDLSGFDGVISAKAPAYVVRHPNHVCYLMHTMRVYYDMFDFSFPVATKDLKKQRRIVRALDRAALQPPRTRRLFAISQEVANRLSSFSGLQAEVIRHPTTLRGLKPDPRSDYLFLPGRLHKWKRVDLAIRAMKLARTPLPLLISGTGEHEPELRALAAGEPRIRFLGRVDDKALADLYAGALAVLFLPVREDLGLVTLEAFECAKPVITCLDSGEPARLVVDGVSGFVCPSEPAAIAAQIDKLARDRDLAVRLGRSGAETVSAITWDEVAGALLGALGFAPDERREAAA